MRRKRGRIPVTAGRAADIGGNAPGCTDSLCNHAHNATTTCPSSLAQVPENQHGHWRDSVVMCRFSDGQQFAM